jgi:homogentisate 1,2-dioxygenase
MTITPDRVSTTEREVRAAARKRAASLTYMAGFGNEHSSEALPGALPIGQNQPQRPPYGTYVELLSVTGFVETRQNTRRSWLYRILPSAVHEPFTRIDNGTLLAPPFTDVPLEPNLLYWDPRPAPPAGTDFVDGLWTLGGNGSPAERDGSAIHLYTANTSMTDRVFSNVDGELLIVPEQGGLLIHTELGLLSVEPGELALIPRAVKFRLEILGPATEGDDEPEFIRGYVIENYGTAFVLPELGYLGQSGVSNPRDFRAPVAAYDDRTEPVQVIHKVDGNLWNATYDHSPLDVVAWHGTVAPYVYNLHHFQMFGPVNFDHPDPSMATALTSTTAIPGANNVDFAIAGPRWIVSEHTFRPAYYHRNVSTEYLGVVKVGADWGGGFQPGVSALTSMLTPHGNGQTAWEYATNAELVPEKTGTDLMFMVETSMPFRITSQAAQSLGHTDDETLGGHYTLKPHFKK